MKKKFKRIAFIFVPLLILVILGAIIFRFLTEYIWMDSLGFKAIFTTIFWTKVSLGMGGFLLFFLPTYLTLYWILKSYLSHFSSYQLPSFILEKKKMFWTFAGISFIVGLVRSEEHTSELQSR